MWTFPRKLPSVSKNELATSASQLSYKLYFIMTKHSYWSRMILHLIQFFGTIQYFKTTGIHSCRLILKQTLSCALCHVRGSDNIPFVSQTSARQTPVSSCFLCSAIMFIRFLFVVVLDMHKSNWCFLSGTQNCISLLYWAKEQSVWLTLFILLSWSSQGLRI